MTDHDETTEIRGAARVLGLLQGPDPIPAAIARLSSPAVTTGATPCPPELAEALAGLLDAWEHEDYEGIHPDVVERVARAVLGWVS